MPQLEPPQNWGEVDAFIRREGLDQSEYFELDLKVGREAPVWTSQTRWILIWLTEGSNEGFYLHIDEVKIIEIMGQRKHGPRETRAIGKFWDIREAMRAQSLLWHYIYGFRLETYVGPQPEAPSVKVEEVSLKLIALASNALKLRSEFVNDPQQRRYLTGKADGYIGARDLLVMGEEEEPQSEPPLEWRGG